MTDQFRIWRYHHENSKLLQTGFAATARYCREFIKRGKTEDIQAQTRLAALNLAALFESRLMEFIFHKDSAAFARRDEILASDTIMDTWHRLIDIGFANLEDIRLRRVPEGLRPSNKARHKAISDAIDLHISPLIELRNALAHGGWVYTLGNDRMTVSPVKMKHLSETNLWQLQVKRNLFRHLSRVVYDLLIASSFERDFDKQFQNLLSAASRLEKDGSKQWEEMLQRRWQRRPIRVKSSSNAMQISTPKVKLDLDEDGY
ncbi:hypothetical protein [Kibdelosporangium aridum]|uniref:hypothetical protein n=1 Tax=Kibdelosporangium aridum TaxID=2030 RepID=UPI000F7960AA|nr:hypothetical protein [Kibdelosporangium aridum]